MNDTTVKPSTGSTPGGSPRGSSSPTATSSRTSGRRHTSSKDFPAAARRESARTASCTSRAWSTRRGSRRACRPRSARRLRVARDYPGIRSPPISRSIRKGTYGGACRLSPWPEQPHHRDCDLLDLRRPSPARTAPSSRTRTSRLASPARDPPQYTLIGRRCGSTLADRERRPTGRLKVGGPQTAPGAPPARRGPRRQRPRHSRKT